MKRKFSWSNFGVDFLRRVIYHPNTPASKKPRGEMYDIDALSAKVGYLYAYPNDRFVKKYKDVIIDCFLANSVYLVDLFRRLEKRNYSDVRVGSEEEMLERLRGMKMTSTVVSMILDEMYRYGKFVPEDYESTLFSTPKIIDLKSVSAKEIPLRNYQQDAKDALYKHFIENDKDSGVLVMPTGSGKTRVAAAFLLEDMIPEGRQIIWLTHRSMLIEQTAETIYSLSPSIKTKAPEKESFEMVCVSGSHSTIMRTGKNDDVIIFSVQTLIRNLPFLKGFLRDNVLIICDESHHALAPSYGTVIKEIRSICKSAKLLGLTATPVRMNDYDTAALMKIFDNNIVYSVSLNELIVSGVLSRPEYIPVNTSVDFSSVLTVDEKKYIEKWGELPPELLDKMGQIAERNKLIVDTYLKNKKEFGKTIVFAVNFEHCRSLCEDFSSAGVNCDYIYCAHSGNEEKINDFKAGNIDILININMLTEGSDIPDIQTVFLTRPTGSDVLLMQMIGRGMRGVDCGGTETVNIVSFNDIWGRFNYWLDPKFVIENEFNDENAVSEYDETIAASDEEIIEGKPIPWEALRYLLDNIHVSYAGETQREVALPSGWMDVVDSDGADRRILVFESQSSGYLELRKHKDLLEDKDGYSAQKIIFECFPDFGLTPSEEDIDIIASHYRLTGVFPHIYPFSGRKKIDAGCVAADLKARNVGIDDAGKEISRLYDENEDIIRSIYGTRQDYHMEVFKYLSNKDGIVPAGMRIEEIPDEQIEFTYGDYYNLDELVSEVKKEMFNDDYGTDIPVRWTRRPYKQYFGEYRWSHDNDLSKSKININCILNSDKVKKEVVKFVIYHEMLHRDNHKHNKEFRIAEHKYPDWPEIERVLYNDFNYYDIKEW